MIVNRTELIRKRIKNNPVQNQQFFTTDSLTINNNIENCKSQINFYSNQENFQFFRKNSHIPYQQVHEKFSKTQNFKQNSPLSQISRNSFVSTKMMTNRDNLSKQGTIRSNNRSSSKSKNSSINKKYAGKLEVDLNQKQLKQFKLQLPNGIEYSQISSLNLNKNNIKQILAGCLSSFSNLKELFINENQLQKISFPYNKLQLKKLELNDNHLTNLNLEHIQGLQHLQAKSNKLIFITIPRSIKSVNLTKNQLSNIYFIEKCRKLQELMINNNFIYDLNFNVDHQSIVSSNISNTSCIKFQYLKIIQASHNKISYLNGFHNIKNILKLNIQSNQINFTRENINQLFQAESLQQLNFIDNPLQGPYDIQSSYQFIISKLQNLVLLNNQQPKNFIFSNDQEQINNQSTIKQGQCNFDSEEEVIESPYRLFIQQSEKKDKENKNKQWIFTLGDCIEQDNQNDKQIFQKMTMTKNQYQNSPLKLLQQKQTKISLKATQNIKAKFIFDQSQKYLKTLGRIGIVPPLIIMHNESSSIISRRIDQDEDQYQLIAKLFQTRNGVVYIKKFYKWNQNEYFQLKQNEFYETGFLNIQIDQTTFQKFKNDEMSIMKLIGEKTNPLINNQPNIFSCYHLILSKKDNKKNKPDIKLKEQSIRFYYLVESKNI